MVSAARSRIAGHDGSPRIKLCPARADEQAAAYFPRAPFVRQLPAAEFEERLHALTHEWAAEGIVAPEQAERIRARHPLVEAGHGAVATLLYAAAGVLLGAAGIALIVVGGGDPDRAQVPFLLVSLALLGAGLAIRLLLRKPLLGDAFLVGALIPGVASGFGSREAFTAWGLALATGLLVWRREGFVPPLAAIAFTVGAASFSMQVLDGGSGSDRVEFVAWTTFQVALLAGVVARDRFLARRDDAATAALAAAGLAASLIPFFSDTVDLRSEGVEAALGACMLVVAGRGAGMRLRGVVLGAAVALAVDAIVFGFDVGGPFTGTLTLLAVAGLLIWQAELVKRYFRA